MASNPEAPSTIWCWLHPVDCYQRARGEARELAGSAGDSYDRAQRSVGTAASDIVERARAGVDYANEQIDRPLERVENTTRWASLGLIAIAVVAVVVALIYFGGPLVTLASNLVKR